MPQPASLASPSHAALARSLSLSLSLPPLCHPRPLWKYESASPSASLPPSVMQRPLAGAEVVSD